MKKDKEYYERLGKSSSEYQAYAKFNRIGNESNLIICTKLREDWYSIVIRGVLLGEFEKSECRVIMSGIDNAI